MDEKMNEENTEEVKVLEAQIQQLQAEVAQLQRQQQNNHKDMTFNFSGQMQEALLYVCGQRRVRAKEEVVSRLEEEMKEMEEDLKRQTQMNGINLNSCTTQTLQSGDSQFIQKFCISGYCSELNFQVEFQLTKFKNQRCEREISDLNVVMDATDLKSINGFLLGVEEHNDLLLFFRTLRTFSDRCDDRSRTFQHFQDKYSSIVSLPGGCRSEIMTLNHPQLPGSSVWMLLFYVSMLLCSFCTVFKTLNILGKSCVLFIHWSVDVSSEGRVTPKINLLTKIPERALQLFPSQTVGGAAKFFQSLLRILGPEAAMESVIRAISPSLDP